MKAGNIDIKQIDEIPNIADGLIRKNKVELGERVLVAGFPYGDQISNTLKVNSAVVVNGT